MTCVNVGKRRLNEKDKETIETNDVEVLWPMSLPSHDYHSPLMSISLVVGTANSVVSPWRGHINVCGKPVESIARLY